MGGSEAELAWKVVRWLEARITGLERRIRLGVRCAWYGAGFVCLSSRGA